MKIETKNYYKMKTNKILPIMELLYLLYLLYALFIRQNKLKKRGHSNFYCHLATVANTHISRPIVSKIVN